MPLFGNDREARAAYIDRATQRFDTLQNEITLMQEITHAYANAVQGHVESLSTRLSEIRQDWDQALR